MENEVRDILLSVNATKAIDPGGIGNKDLTNTTQIILHIDMTILQML